MGKAVSCLMSHVSFLISRNSRATFSPSGVTSIVSSVIGMNMIPVCIQNIQNIQNYAIRMDRGNNDQINEAAA